MTPFIPPKEEQLQLKLSNNQEKLRTKPNKLEKIKKILKGKIAKYKNNKHNLPVLNHPQVCKVNLFRVLQVSLRQNKKHLSQSKRRKILKPRRKQSHRRKNKMRILQKRTTHNQIDLFLRLKDTFISFRNQNQSKSKSQSMRCRDNFQGYLVKK
jgi:hypothetical protein